MVDAQTFRGTRPTALSSTFVNDPTAAPPTLGYLGPVGTFTEQAVFTQPDLAAMDHRRFGTIVEVLRAVESETVDYGFAAIENMIEGAVNATIDTLAFDAELLIQREVVMNISMNLLAHSGVTLDQIAHVRSIPVAYAQCRRFLTDTLPHAAIEATNSTADAARELADSGRRDTAAIAPQRAAEVYGLETLAADIEDHPENQTRFVLVSRDGITPATGHDKSSIVIYQRADEPGSLVAILSEFAARNINLTKLESRPTRKGLGDYCFLIDCEGHISDGLVGDALRNIHMKHGRVKFLGSYPSAYDTAEVQNSNRAGVAEGDEWLAGLRSRIR
jgi:prephenate dehydratase